MTGTSYESHLPAPADDDIVAHAVDIVRCLPVPALPPSLPARVVASVHATADRPAAPRHLHPFPSRTSRRMALALALTAGVALVALTHGLMDLSPSATLARSAAADVVDTVRRAGAVRYVKEHSGTKIHVLEQGGVVREELPDGAIMIMDYTAGRILHLDPAAKAAIRGTITGGGSPDGESLLALFRDRVMPARGTLVGRVRVGAMEAEDYVFPCEDDLLITMRADPRTRLPLEVVLRGPAWLPVRDTTFREFDWNPVFDAGELTLEVPGGYTVDRLQSVDLSLMSFAERRREYVDTLACGTCLTEFLSVYADRFQGEFPDALDAAAVKIEGWALMQPAVRDVERFGAEALRLTVEDVSTKWERLVGLKASLQALGRELHYLGRNRHRGDGQGAIAWWETFERRTCIVVADDLTIRELPTTSLPAALRAVAAGTDGTAEE